ncbi:MAG: DUF6382 domain-containing protein [Lachnospiraceae bacterium]|nr:DUF6382 domain-containing protein [Lachnospiraceae bacterium]
MKVSYKREMRHNYLILDALEPNPESFEIRMLAGNSIEGLLKFRVKQEEQNRYYYYEITSKQPLSRILEFREIKREELSRLITGIGAALNGMEDYLLQESRVLLEPEYIYIQPESYQIWLCYVPGYEGNFPEAMEKLLQYLLKKADHHDDDTVVLAYRLFQECQKDYFGMEDLLQAVRESQRGSQKKEPDGGAVERKRERSTSQSSVCDGKRTPEGGKYGSDSNVRKKRKGPDLTEEDRAEASVPDEKTKDFRQRRMEVSAEDIPENISEDSFHKETNPDSAKELPETGDGHGIGRQICFLIVFLLAGPAAVWLLKGIPGLREYGPYLLAADIGILSGFAGFLFQKKKKAKAAVQKIPVNSKMDWYMTFEEDEAEEETESGLNGENSEPARRGLRRKDGETVPEKGQSRGKTEAAEPQFEEGPNTVLLSEAAGSGGRQHVLKSLDLSIADIPIPYFPFIIGKQEGIVDYVLNRDTVSRLHLRIDEEDGVFQVTDLNSSNGTSVGEDALEANELHPLFPGDKLNIADISFIFY